MRRLSPVLFVAAVVSGCPNEPADTTEALVLPPPVAEPAPSFFDEIARPEQPTVDPSAFNSAQACISCHPTHVEEWETSMHAYAMVDPVFQAMTEIRQADYDGEQDMFCVSCHSAIATRGGEIVPNFHFEDLSPIAMEGVTCDACHKITDVSRTFNGGHVLDPEAPMQGTIADPVFSSFHESEYNEVTGSPELCASCHDVIEISGLDLERPYQEFLESPSNATGDNCQTCHMPSRTAPAAIGGPDREVHSHEFIGVDVPLQPGWLTVDQEQEIIEKTVAMFEGVASLHLQTADTATPGQQLDVVVSMVNNIDGHNFPTGTTFIRQTWLDMTATDATGRVLFRTGDLDANGDLRNAWSELDPYGDFDLVTYHSGFIDPLGSPEIFSWRASEHFSMAVGPRLDRTATLFVPVPEDAVGPVTIDAKLRFRSHPPYLLRQLGLGDLVDRILTVEVDHQTSDIPLTAETGN